MSHPSQTIKIIGILLFLLLFMLISILTVQAAAEVTLIDMEKQEELGRTRIVLHFSALPEFEVDHNAQRVDLLLKDVWPSEKLQNLPEDETVVKILLVQQHRDLLTSILLRRTPKQVVSESKDKPARIIMDLFWEGESDVRPGVAFRIAEMPARKPGAKAKEYERQSPWDGRWREFFHDYRSYWKLKLPLSYTLPALSPLVTDQQSPLWPLQQFATQKKWLVLIHYSDQISGLTPEETYQLTLLVAEAQLRTEAYAAGLAHLEVLKDQQGPEQVRVEYLTAYALAASGQPFVAQVGMREMLAELQEGEVLSDFYFLLAAETALDSKLYKEALEYLQTDQLTWPMELQTVVDLRTADALAGLGKLSQAVDGYQGLLEEPGLFEHYLYSLNLAAFSAYRSGVFEFAYQLYHKLSEQVKQLPGADLVQFATGASAYAAGNLDWGLIGLQKAALDWPGTEGGERAEMRLIDHSLLNGGDLELAEAASSYGQLGKHAVDRMVREEAAFKQALALYLLKDYQASVEDLMRFRREFGSSKLRREADLLLLAQIPKVVRRLREQKNELAAVVLVEQNRKLLLRGGIDQEFLNDLAGAFDNLGLYARAGRVLLYLYDKAESDAARKQLYLPLAESFLKRNEFTSASDYARRYLEKYPHGKDRGALFGILLDAFKKQGRNDELLAWLGQENRPSTSELEIRAAWIYWDLERLVDAANSLEKALQTRKGMEVKEMALLGEIYYQLGRNSSAENIYEQLAEEQRYTDQARYRLAQLRLRQHDRPTALKLLTELVDENANSSWGKLAQDLLIQEEQ